MTILLRRVPSMLLALAAIGAAVFMATSRNDRSWSVEPTWPYVQPARSHWFYRTFQSLPSEHMRLGIWGWAAHAWVYTGTIPATRETSTEFAWLDLGSNGYYRKRFLETLKETRPEYFMVAVGPGHFLFKDRGSHGVQTLPELEQFLRLNYTTVLDDGETGLFVRNDFYEDCCQPKQVTSSNGDSSTQEEILPLQQAQGEPPAWARAAASEGDQTIEASWTISAHRDVDAIVVPFRFSQSTDRSQLRIGVRDATGTPSGCEAALATAPAETISMCILEQPKGADWTISGRIANPKTGDWIEIGRPFLAGTDVRP